MCIYQRWRNKKSFIIYLSQNTATVYQPNTILDIAHTHIHTHDRMFCIKNNYFSIIYLFDSFKFVFVSKKKSKSKRKFIKECYHHHHHHANIRILFILCLVQYILKNSIPWCCVFIDFINITCLNVNSELIFFLFCFYYLSNYFIGKFWRKKNHSNSIT